MPGIRFKTEVSAFGTNANCFNQKNCEVQGRRECKQKVTT